jgi:hypothetical protein
MGDDVNWAQLLIGAGVGVLLTFVLARGLDFVRNRPRLEVRLHEARERLYVRRDLHDGQPRFLVCEPTDPAALLVITLDLLVVNKSYQADGLVSVQLSSPAAGWSSGLRGRERADEPFRGLNVDAHSIAPARLRFFLHRDSRGQEPGFGPAVVRRRSPGSGATRRNGPGPRRTARRERIDTTPRRARRLDPAYPPGGHRHLADPLPEQAATEPAAGGGVEGPLAQSARRGRRTLAAGRPRTPTSACADEVEASWTAGGPRRSPSPRPSRRRPA